MRSLAGWPFVEGTMMKCDLCKATIDPGEEREHKGQALCDDCYMEALSPVKVCDPWAVYSAKSLEKHSGGVMAVTPIQAEILQVLEATGGLEPVALLEQLQGKLTLSQLEREFAALRHMEKARGEKRDDKVYVRLW
jgi:hypothetical protein